MSLNPKSCSDESALFWSFIERLWPLKLQICVATLVADVSIRQLSYWDTKKFIVARGSCTVAETLKAYMIKLLLENGITLEKAASTVLSAHESLELATLIPSLENAADQYKDLHAADPFFESIGRKKLIFYFIERLEASMKLNYPALSILLDKNISSRQIKYWVTKRLFDWPPADTGEKLEYDFWQAFTLYAISHYYKKGCPEKRVSAAVSLTNCQKAKWAERLKETTMVIDRPREKNTAATPKRIGISATRQSVSYLLSIMLATGMPGADIVTYADLVSCLDADLELLKNNGIIIEVSGSGDLRQGKYRVSPGYYNSLRARLPK